MMSVTMNRIKNRMSQLTYRPARKKSAKVGSVSDLPAIGAKWVQRVESHFLEAETKTKPEANSDAGSPPP